MERYNRVMLGLTEGDWGADVIDMAKLFGSDTRYFSDMVHYTTDGIRRFGEILAGELAPTLPTGDVERRRSGRGVDLFR